MTNPPIPSIHAVLIGINDYKEYPPLKSAVGDARKIADFLMNHFNVPKENITMLLDSQATRGNIIHELYMLQYKPGLKRNDAILVFFSGYAGTAHLEESGHKTPIGMLCPADIHEQPGIPDKTLIQLFDQVSKSRGNNITVFLDCASDIFSWGNPSSFVVIAPKRATETEDGGAFTKLLIRVLKWEKRLDALTVQCLADKIQAEMDDVDVLCFGQNINNLVFNPIAGRAYHVFIPGHTTKDGNIKLAAGSAHGVQKGGRYSIYPYNIKSRYGKVLGHLEVSSVDTEISATLSYPDGASFFVVPTVFFAAETYFPDEQVGIFFSNDSPHIPAIQSLPRIYKGELEKTNLSLKFDNGHQKVTISWLGFPNDPKHMRRTEHNGDIEVDLKEKDRIARVIRNAARFAYHVNRIPQTSSLVYRRLRAELLQVDELTDQPTGENILKGSFAEMKLATGEIMGPYCLVLKNDNAFPVWPYVFVCQSNGFDIWPWYTPLPGTTTPPLKAKSELRIGCGDEEGLMFDWRPGFSSNISYIKIFATIDKTDFSFLMQRFRSPTEDTLRESVTTQIIAPPIAKSISDHAPRNGPGKTRLNKLVGGRARWASIRITILEKYVDNDSGN